MIVSKEVTLGDVIFVGSILPIVGSVWAFNKLRRSIASNWSKRKEARAKALKAANRKAPKRSAKKRVPRIVTAKDHRKHYGAPPALRIILGGKS